MAYAGLAIDAQEALELLVKYRQANSKDLILACDQLSPESRAKVKSGEMTPAQGFVEALRHGWRPSMLTDGGQLSFYPINCQPVIGVLRDEANRVLIGAEIQCKKTDGLTRLVNFSGQFDSIQLGRISYLITQVREQSCGGVHIFLAADNR